VSLSRILADPKIIEVDGVRIPVCSLEDHLVSYRRLKRPKDAEKIRKISQRQDTLSSQRRMERTKDTE
jgi:predicted nucleotidyltransferase